MGLRFKMLFERFMAPFGTVHMQCVYDSRIYHLKKKKINNNELHPMVKCAPILFEDEVRFPL